MIRPVEGAKEQEGLFASTHWSLVREAADSEVESDIAARALTELCRTYWPPIYGYLRRRGYSLEDAQDLTQSFFAHLIENDTLRRAARDKGRFRNFLLGALKLCLADDHTRRRALKRGGAVQFISMDDLAAEELHRQGMGHQLSADELLDARWAGALLERALARVRNDFLDASKAETFEALSPFSGRRKTRHLVSGCRGTDGLGPRRGQDANPPPAAAIRQLRCARK